MIIYSKDGIQKCEVKKFTYNGTFLGETFIMFSITNKVPIEFAIGDYCNYRSERFELNYIPSKEKVASKNSYSEAFKYDDVKFNFLANELVNCSFLDYVPSGNSLHYNGLSTFTFTGTVRNLAERIKANLDRLYTGDKVWTITVAPEVESETINVNASNINCFEALSLAKSEFDLNFIIRNRTITIGYIGIDAGRTFGYGKGNGLISIKQTVNNDSKIITRLRAFGSSKNIPSRWYNKQINPSTGLPYIPDSMYVPNLMLPDFLSNGGDAYIEDSLASKLSYDGGNATSNTIIYTFDGGTSVVTPSITIDGGNSYSGTSYVDTYGVREGTVYFDGTGDNEEIYPSIKGITASQLSELGIAVTLNAGDNGNLDEIYSATNPTDNGVIPTDGNELNKTFSVVLKDLGFDLSEKLSDGSYKYASSDGEITLSLTSGNCAGRDFIVTNITKLTTAGVITYKLDLNRDEDTDIGMAFPNSTYTIWAGNTFVLINIQMPDVWVNLASQKLYNKALEYLSVNNKPKYSYELNIDNIFMANNPSIGGSLKEGDTITFEDLDLPVSNKVIISSLEIKEEESLIPKYAVTLSNDITVSTIQQILNSVNDNQISIKQTKKDILTYTGRSFADVKETADALALAFNNYSAGITPAYVNTLSLIAGTESQQFRFVDSNTTNTPNIINHGFKWLPDIGYGTLDSDGNKYLQHLTLGITSLTSSNYARYYTEYKFWYLPNQSFVIAEHDNNLKYAYAKCDRNSLSASYVLSETPFVWDEDETYYYFLIGILNSVRDGSRSYTEVYGYTEILPSRITTEKIISSNGQNYFGLDDNKFHIGNSDNSSYLDWNHVVANGLSIKGIIVQSQSGDESPIGVNRGDFNASYVYYVGDLVAYNGSTYMCIANTTAGILPTNTSYWKLYAGKGDNAITVQITGNNIFKYPKNSSTPENLCVTLTMNVQGITPTDYNWQYWNGNAWSDFGFHNQSCNIYADPWLNGKTSLRIVGSINSGAYFDEYTLYKLYDGTDTINVILSNESHTVACDKDGVPKTGEIAKAMTAVSVYRGATELTFDGGWSIDEFVSGGATFIQSDDTIQLQSFLNGYSSAWCDITVVIGTVYITKRFSVAKSIDGQTGMAGDYFEYRYAVNGSPTDAPSIVISDAVPTGWSTSMPTQTLVQYTWITSAKKSSYGELLTYWSTPIRVTGIRGDTGPAMSYKGNWVNGNTYYGSSLLINVVYYSGIYYMSRYDIDGGTFVSSVSPDQDSEHWNPFGSSFESVATGLLLAQSAYIENLIVSKLGTSSNPYSERFSNIGSGVGIFKNQSDENSINNAIIAMGRGLSLFQNSEEKTPSFVVYDKQWLGNYSNTRVYYYNDRVFYNNGVYSGTYRFVKQWDESETPSAGHIPPNIPPRVPIDEYWYRITAGTELGGGGYTQVCADGFFTNGSRLRVTDGLGLTVGNASNINLLFNKIEDPSKFSAAVVGIDRSGSTGTSASYGGWFDSAYIGRIVHSIRNVSASGAILKSDCIIHCYNTSTITLTMPTPDNSMVGQTIKFRKLGPQTVYITTSTSYKFWHVSELTTLTLDNDNCFCVTWDGNYWVTEFTNQS